MTEPVHTIADTHRERVFEEHLVSCLVTEQGYVERECAAHYDPEAALPDQLPLSYESRIVSRDGTRTGFRTLSEMGTTPNSSNLSSFAETFSICVNEPKSQWYKKHPELLNSFQELDNIKCQ